MKNIISIIILLFSTMAMSQQTKLIIQNFTGYNLSFVMWAKEIDGHATVEGLLADHSIPAGEVVSYNKFSQTLVGTPYPWDLWRKSWSQPTEFTASFLDNEISPDFEWYYMKLFLKDNDGNYIQNGAGTLGLLEFPHNMFIQQSNDYAFSANWVTLPNVTIVTIH